MRRLLVLLVGAALILAIAPQARADDLTLTLTRFEAAYGTVVMVQGTGPAGTPAVIERLALDGAWHPVATVTTDSAGLFRSEITATASGSVRVAVPGTLLVSVPVPMEVRPRLEVPRRLTQLANAAQAVDWRIRPRSYAGAVSVTRNDGAVIARGVARGGRVRLMLPAGPAGTTPATVSAAAHGELVAATQGVTLITAGPRLSIGMRHPAVRPMLQRLRTLNYHIPRLTSRYSKPVSDVVMAFQKIEGLRRTATVGPKTWKALAAARPVKARVRTPGTHIEVDKTRQTLKVVRNGDVLGTLHVSTGLTGNTPEGRFRIYAKGVGSLYRFMPFIGNFGIHGYIPVPSYPASHGCVREPMWAADWTYNHARIGTKVVIFP